jgi:uncharacterized protein YqkB
MNNKVELLASWGTFYVPDLLKTVRRKTQLVCCREESIAVETSSLKALLMRRQDEHARSTGKRPALEQQPQLFGDQMLRFCKTSGISLSRLAAHSSGQMHQSMSELSPFKKKQMNEEMRHEERLVSNYKHISQICVTI